jgi:hypothetical protein
MPKLTRLHLKTALAYLILALAIALLLAVGQTVKIPPLLLGLQPVYFHLFMVGWVAQLIFGVAWWMFPPLSPERPRGDERFIWVAYGALNVGLILRAVSEPFHSVDPNALWSYLLIASAVLQVVAIWIYVVALWPRVKDPSRARRVEKDQK